MVTINNLRNERRQQKMTQRTVAEELGISYRTMCMYELGKWPIGLQHANAYAELLGFEFRMLKK